MKILHTVQHYPPYVGGMAEVVGRLSRELVKRGHEVTVATLFHPDREQKIIDGVAIEEFRIEGNAVIGIRGEYRKYQDFLLRGEFEIIVNFAAPHWATDLMLPLLDNIKAVKVFVPTGFSTLFDPAYAPYFNLLAVLMKKYDMNVFTGREYRDFAFAQQAGVEKCRIIPNGAAAEEFLRQSDGDIRQQLGIPQTDELILHVGSFTGLKGQLEAIEIFRHAPLTNATLLLVGNESHPEYYALCREAVDRFMEAPERQTDSKRILIASLSREETVRAFQAARLFLFPSRLECSPIVLFECLAAKTPFLTSDVGNAREIIRWSGGGKLLPTYQDSAGFSHVMVLEGGSILAELLQAKEQLAQMADSGFAAWQKSFTWEKLAGQYEVLYQELAAEKLADSVQFNPLLTVAAMTVGDPAFALCEEALKQQTLRGFCYKVIRNVSPISAACQQMIAAADTPYLLQLDEDMILYPDALERMLAAIEAAPDDIGMICFHLWDEDRAMRIQGIKIWKTACLAQVVWQDTRASDVEVLEQIGRLGFKWVLHPDIVGIHGVLYNIDTIYRRYKSMYEKDITEWNLVTGDVRAKAEHFRQTGDVLQLFALLGAVHGMVVAPYSEDREKDFHDYQLKTLDVLKKLLLSPTWWYACPYDAGKPEKNRLTNQPLKLEEVQWLQPVISRCIAEFNDTLRQQSAGRHCYLWCDTGGLTRFFQIADLAGVPMAGIILEIPDDLVPQKSIAGLPLVDSKVLQEPETASGKPFVIVSAIFCRAVLAFLAANGYQEGRDFVRNTLLP